MPPSEAVIGVRKDLLDAYQARLITYLEEADRGRREGLRGRLRRERRDRRRLLADHRPRVPGAARAKAERIQADRDFAALAAAAERGDTKAFIAARDSALDDIDGFTAAPFTPEEQARRAQQLTRFLDLIPIEYDRGHRGRRGDPRLRDPGGRRLQRGGPRGVQRPRVDADRARPRGRRDRATPRSPSSTASRTRPTRAARSPPRTRSSRPTTTPASALEEMSPRSGPRAAPRPTSTWSRSASTRWRPRSAPASASRPSRPGSAPTRSSSSAPSACCARSTRSSSPRSRASSGTAPRGEQGLAELIASDDTTSRDVRETRLALDERARGRPRR